MQEQNIIPTDAKWASVIISAPVKPDEFMAVAASYDKTLRYGAQTPFNDQLESHWEGGKWEVDATHDSIITAGNGGDKPAQAQVTLFFNGGTGKYQIEQTLAPDQQLWLDLGRLIRDRVPDKNGNTLPSDLTSGTYQFRDLTQSPGSSLFEGKVITDKTYGHAAYGCMICCGHGSGFMWIDPLGVGAGYQQTQTVGAIDNCDGNPYTYGWEYPNWWTGNTSIATASTQQINGIAAGATGDFANGRINTGDGMTYVQQCPMDNDSPQGDTNVDDFTLSGTASTFDGFQGNFTIAVTGGTATNYAWSATAPPGAGNNPSVTFNQPHNASTTTDAHWFALPNVACGASASSTYTITAAVSFNDLTSPISKSTQYTVKLPPDGGAVFDGDADVAGAPSEPEPRGPGLLPRRPGPRLPPRPDRRRPPDPAGARHPGRPRRGTGTTRGVDAVRRGDAGLGA